MWLPFCERQLITTGKKYKEMCDTHGRVVISVQEVFT